MIPELSPVSLNVLGKLFLWDSQISLLCQPPGEFTQITWGRKWNKNPTTVNAHKQAICSNSTALKKHPQYLLRVTSESRVERETDSSPTHFAFKAFHMYYLNSHCKAPTRQAIVGFYRQRWGTGSADLPLAIRRTAEAKTSWVFQLQSPGAQQLFIYNHKRYSHLSWGLAGLRCGNQYPESTSPMLWGRALSCPARLCHRHSPGGEAPAGSGSSRYPVGPQHGHGAQDGTIHPPQSISGGSFLF